MALLSFIIMCWSYISWSVHPELLFLFSLFAALLLLRFMCSLTVFCKFYLSLCSHSFVNTRAMVGLS